MYKSVAVRLGRYEAFQELGRKVQRTTYLARDPEIERLLIIRSFEQGTANWADDWATRLATIGELSHKSFVRLLDFSGEEGSTFIVTEFIEGESLEQILARGRLTEEQAIALIQQLLDALSYLEEKRVPHLNLKPSNLFVTPNGELKVADFGGLGSEPVTAFMAPEQLRGAGDQRSDLFAVGVLFYLMLSGHRPFQGNTDSTIEFKLVHQHPVPVAAMNFDLSPELDSVVGRFLAKDPSARYASAAEAKEDLESLGARDGLVTSGFPRTPHVVLAKGTQVGHKGNTAHAGGNSGAWKYVVPACLSCAAIAIFAVAQPFLRTVPPPASIAKHMSVPNLASERSSKLKRSRKITKVRVQDSSVAVVTPVGPNAKSASGTKQPAPELVAIPVELQQPFRECNMSIWVDEHVVYSNAIRADAKKRFLGLGASVAGYLTLVQIPTGEHAIRVEVRDAAGKNNKSGNLSATISPISGQKLRVRYDKDRAGLEATLN